MSVVDHVFAGLIVFGPLVLAVLSRPGALSAFADEAEKARRAALRQSALLLLALAAAAVGLWFVQGRAVEGMRLGLFAAPAWAWQLVAAISVLLLVEPLLVALSARAGRAVLRAYGALAALFPRSAAELATVLGVSVAAGIGEEILYRGYLLGYFEAFMPQAAALGASSLAFGLAHLYQGRRAALLIAFVGAGFGALTLAAGSLAPAMVLHAATDAATFLAGYVMLRRGLR